MSQARLRRSRSRLLLVLVFHSITSFCIERPVQSVQHVQWQYLLNVTDFALPRSSGFPGRPVPQSKSAKWHGCSISPLYNRNHRLFREIFRQNARRACRSPRNTMATTAGPPAGSGVVGGPPPFVLSWLTAGGHGPPPWISAGFSIPSVVTVVTTPVAPGTTLATSDSVATNPLPQSKQSTSVSPSSQTTSIPSPSQTPAVESFFATFTVTSLAASATTTPTDSGGLSSGAKAGIGVGVALGIVLIVALSGFAWFFYRNKQRRERNKDAVEMDGSAAEKAEKKDDAKIQEIGGSNLVELEATEKPSELEDSVTNPPKYTYERTEELQAERIEEKQS